MIIPNFAPKRPEALHLEHILLQPLVTSGCSPQLVLHCAQRHQLPRHIFDQRGDLRGQFLHDTFGPGHSCAFLKECLGVNDNHN